MEEKYINILLKLANKASDLDEVPVAAIITYGDKIIAKSYNKRVRTNRTTSHAEIEAITKANKKMKDWRLNGCVMYVTIRPCEMCEKVIKESRIEKVYYLVDRDIKKVQYSKTEFLKIAENQVNEEVKKYKNKLSNFWKNKRNNKDNML